MTYHPNPLAKHIEDVINVWWDFNKNHITEESVEALQQTIRLTLLEWRQYDSEPIYTPNGA